VVQNGRFMGYTESGQSRANQGIPRFACNPDLNHALDVAEGEAARVDPPVPVGHRPPAAHGGLPPNPFTSDAVPPRASCASPSPASPAAGGGPGMGWVNAGSKSYHFPGGRYYGKTKRGEYMTEAAAKAAGAHHGGKNCF